MTGAAARPCLLMVACIVFAGCGASANKKNTIVEPARTTTARAAGAAPASVSPQQAIAGTVLPSQGNVHVNPGEAHVAYTSNPPTSGPHFPVVPRPGVYAHPFSTEYLPRFLEHGGAEVLYSAAASSNVIKKLTDIATPLLNRAPGLVLLAPRPGMPCQVTLTAWGRMTVFGAPNCQSGAVGHPFDPRSAVDVNIVREFLLANQCKYDPENQCGAGAHGALTYPTPAPGDATVVAETGSAPAPPAPTGPSGSPLAFKSSPPLTIDKTATYIATIKTSKGDVVVQLNASAAPVTVNNFVFLAQSQFYDGLTCHRVIPGFVAQCGDPSGDGSGGPGYTIPDEQSPMLHGLGAIAMAKSAQPNSAGSQFYITLAPQPALDGKYTVFGIVTAGMDVVQKLTPRDPASNPRLPPGDQIISITITKQ